MLYAFDILKAAKTMYLTEKHKTDKEICLLWALCRGDLLVYIKAYTALEKDFNVSLK